jgi:hypothetical protein
MNNPSTMSSSQLQEYWKSSQTTEPAQSFSTRDRVHLRQLQHELLEKSFQSGAMTREEVIKALEEFNSES